MLSVLLPYLKQILFKRIQKLLSSFSRGLQIFLIGCGVQFFEQSVDVCGKRVIERDRCQLTG